MVLGTLKILYVVFEVGFLLVSGMQIVLKGLFVFIVSFLDLLNARYQNNLVDLERFVVLIHCFLGDELLQLASDSQPSGNVLDDDCVVR